LNKKKNELFQALEFATDPPLTDALAHLWTAIRKFGEESIKCVDDKNTLTRMIDNYRQLMPEIKQSIVSEHMTMKNLKGVNIFFIFGISKNKI